MFNTNAATHEKGATRKTAHAKSTRELAIDLLDANPQASRSNLLDLYGTAVRADVDYLDALIEAQGTNDLNWAQNFIARRDEKPSTKQHAATKKKQRAAAARTKAAKTAETLYNVVLLNVIAENGKKLRDLTGNELDQLADNNSKRGDIYRALRRKVKFGQMVGEVLNEDDVRNVLKRIGDPSDLATLFT